MNRLDGNREIERHRYALERIVAVLLLMAGLAELAAGFSARRRIHALDQLACGEAEARGFVIELCGVSVEDGASMQAAISAGDAARLAVSFRVLALVLGAMLTQARRATLAGDPHAVSPIARRWPDGQAHTRLPSWALPPPDTS